MEEHRLGVLVGLDRSECSRQALDWAVADAAARGSRLTVAYVLDVHRIGDVPMSAGVLAIAERNGQQTLDEALEQAGRAAPGITTEARSVSGNPAGELLRLAETADEVVLGSRGHGGFATLMLGSTAGQVAAHASCPAVVVRGGATAGGPVIVGVDGSERGEAALEYGFGYAARHGLPLHALHLCPSPVTLSPYAMTPVNQYVDMDRAREDAGRAVGQAVDRWSAKHPEVAATWSVADGAATQGLVEASEGASLLVVGCRGHGGFAGMLLGSVSQAAIRHAHCPVAVAR